MLQIHHKREVLGKLDQARELISDLWYWTEGTNNKRIEAVEKHLDILYAEFWRELQKDEQLIIKKDNDKRRLQASAKQR